MLLFSGGTAGRANPPESVEDQIRGQRRISVGLSLIPLRGLRSTWKVRQMTIGSLPRLIDAGRVAQSLVEYVGPRKGSFGVRGPASGRSYRFSALASSRLQHVLAIDLPLFELRVDFRVLDEGAIGPSQERRAEIRENLTDELTAAIRSQLLAELSPSSPKPSRARRGGRRPGTGLGALIDCWMSCQRTEDRFDSKREAYDAVCRALESELKADEVPTRVQIPKLRWDAKRRREQLGHCVYHAHPAQTPPLLQDNEPSD